MTVWHKLASWFHRRLVLQAIAEEAHRELLVQRIAVAALQADRDRIRAGRDELRWWIREELEREVNK